MDPPSSIVPILDIRQEKVQLSLQNEIRDMLSVRDRECMQVPWELFWDAKGLQIFEQMTYLDDYYPTKTELAILDGFADQLACTFQEGSILVELGSGNLRKVDILLRAIDRTGKKNIRYFALDLDHAELVRSLAKLPAYKNVSCSGLWGSYEDGFRWLNGLEKRQDPVILLSLGSSVGNFPRANAITFMRNVSQTLHPELADAFLIAFDHCGNPSKVWKAYHDSNGVHEGFVLNGLRHSNSIMGYELFDLEAWRYVGEFDHQDSCYRSFCEAIKDTSVGGHTFRVGERIKVGLNIKYPKKEAQGLFDQVGLKEAARWENTTQDY
ncbi:MAG: hypothetical protein Q9187_004824, partial [Circinaria calcarea]